MKQYFIKMSLLILMSISSINIYFKGTSKILVTNTVANTILKSDVSNSSYQNIIVYEGLTLRELGIKIDNVLNSTLDGYGEIIANLALENEVDPIVAASIILVETGCKWTCSSLVRNSNNVGGMKNGRGSYAKFASLEAGIEAFINNLAKNYYQKGLTTPELMNRKYAANPNWHQDVNYYVKLIKAS